MTNATLNYAKPDRRIGRSIWAVFAGFLFVVITHTGMDAIMHGTGVFPPVGTAMADSLFALALGYRTVLTAVGSYYTARLAPANPMKHALIGGAIGLVLSIAGAAATWNSGPAFGPHWYPGALAILAVPTAWIGGKIHELTQGVRS
jgi:hypothetical protein